VKHHRFVQLAAGLWFLVFGYFAPAAAPRNVDFTAWNSASGNWTNAALWSGVLPNPFQRAEVHGNSSIVIPSGNFVVGDLEVGLNSGDRARVESDGGRLVLMQDSLRVGEYTGGEGEFVLKDGAMHGFMDVFVGGASGVPGRETKATLRIQGGSFLGRTLTVGVGWGAQSLVSIEGSRPSAVHALDYVELAAFADTNGAPGDTTLAFTLDEHGVTPITIQSRYRGLWFDKDAKSHCHLQIRLSAVPPRDDVTLVSAHTNTRGTFDDLPEGSEIRAEFAGHIYRWRLTYKGGSAGHDVVLRNRSDYAATAPVTHTRPIPEIPKALWTGQRLYPLSAETRGEPAFAGAEGFGASAAGGRGGKTIYVENLNDSGPGTLRAAIETPGARTILFRVGGVIPLESTLKITEPCVTIDGSQAPGPGILIRNHGLEVRTHDVVLRYFRVRIGDDNVKLDNAKAISAYAGGDGEQALYFIDGAKNCIADHLSLSWSTGKILSVTKLSDLITVQWCILSEALNFADHGYASIAGGNRVTWHHNLFAHNFSRNVRFQGMVDADFRNNVVYDWGECAAYGEFERLNYVGNYLKAGPSTRQRPYFFFHLGDAEVMPGSLFVTNNILEGTGARPGVNTNNWYGMGGYFFERGILAAREPFAAPFVKTELPADAFEHVLHGAGATLPERDAVDTRVVREVRSGTGHIINWVQDAGGWPKF
jgi:pectate lyase